MNFGSIKHIFRDFRAERVKKGMCVMVAIITRSLLAFSKLRLIKEPHATSIIELGRCSLGLKHP